jgi:hypothetical protein
LAAKTVLSHICMYLHVPSFQTRLCYHFILFFFTIFHPFFLSRFEQINK